MNLKKLQADHKQWANKNFNHREPKLPRQVLHCAMGASEEVGELMHALLKWDQGIRGTPEEHEEKARDAVGDVVMYLLDLCNRMGWSMEDILVDVSEEVHGRDWNEERELMVKWTPYEELPDDVKEKVNKKESE